ncbi:hypothetical protein D3C79_1115210 [compost metagenome]
MQFTLSHFQLGEDSVTAFQKQCALRRECDCSGGAMKQPNAKPLFQPGHGFANSG